MSSCVKALIRLFLRGNLGLRQQDKHLIGAHIGLNYQTLFWMKYLTYPFFEKNSQTSFLQLLYAQEIISQIWNIVYFSNNMIDSIQ